MQTFLPPTDKLNFIYKPPRCHLSFHQEHPQEIIFRNIDIKEIRTLRIIDLETEEHSYRNDLLTEFNSFYELMMIEDDNCRFGAAHVFMKDGTVYLFDLNLSEIVCEDPEKLFQLAKPIFDA